MVKSHLRNECGARVACATLCPGARDELAEIEQAAPTAGIAGGASCFEGIESGTRDRRLLNYSDQIRLLGGVQPIFLLYLPLGARGMVLQLTVPGIK